MLSALLAVVGLALIIAATVDALWTTLALDGAGPISGRVSTRAWRMLLGIHHRRESHRLLSFGATIILTAILIVWLTMLWFGWALLFSADPNAVLDVFDRGTVGFVERLYFAGFVLTTLGTGDFVPGGLWRIVVPLCATNGLLVITLAITYVLPVMDAGRQGRQLATFISEMGQTPQELVFRIWTDTDAEFGEFDDGERERTLEQYESYLTTLAQMVNAHTHRHVAYPVLHYVHSGDPNSAVVLRIAALDEALTILSYAVDPEIRPHPLVMRNLRGALTGYFTILSDIYVHPSEDVPPEPSLAALRERGVPLEAERTFEDQLEEIEERRRIILSLVRHDGWQWKDIHPRQEEEPEEREKEEESRPETTSEDGRSS